VSGGSRSIDQATAEQSAVDQPGFAPPVAGEPSVGSPPPVSDPPPSASSPPPSGTDDASSSGPKTLKLPTGGVEALERPEGQVGLAFAGGFVVALILKRLVG
jgi:hypothetical protein